VCDRRSSGWIGGRSALPRGDRGLKEREAPEHRGRNGGDFRPADVNASGRATQREKRRGYGAGACPSVEFHRFPQRGTALSRRQWVPKRKLLPHLWGITSQASVLVSVPFVPGSGPTFYLLLQIQWKPLQTNMANQTSPFVRAGSTGKLFSRCAFLELERRTFPSYVSPVDGSHHHTQCQVSRA
jgi:hypothetical protein